MLWLTWIGAIAQYTAYTSSFLGGGCGDLALMAAGYCVSLNGAPGCNVVGSEVNPSNTAAICISSTAINNTGEKTYDAQTPHGIILVSNNTFVVDYCTGGMYNQTQPCYFFDGTATLNWRTRNVNTGVTFNDNPLEFGTTVTATTGDIQGVVTATNGAVIKYCPPGSAPSFVCISDFAADCDATNFPTITNYPNTTSQLHLSCKNYVTSAPTATPTAQPTVTPTEQPTFQPTVAPTATPTANSTAPTATPTSSLTPSPTNAPKKSSLSTGAIVGIAIAMATVLAVFGYVVISSYPQTKFTDVSKSLL